MLEIFELKENGEKSYISFHEACRRHYDVMFAYIEDHPWMTEFIARYEQQNEDHGHARIPLDSDKEEELKPIAKNLVTSTSLKKSNFPQIDTLILDGGCDTCSIGEMHG